MKKYKTILIDPPWEIKFGFDNHRDKRKSTGSPKGTWTRPNMNYQTLTLEEIRSLPIISLADENCHLYLWVINKYIPDAYDLINYWKFKPSTLLTWVKTPRGLGLGGAFVQTTEHILFAYKGKQEPKQRLSSTWWNFKRPENITGPKHSRKPEGFQDIVEIVSHAPYLEMFARRKRTGWDVWGNEVKSDILLDSREDR